MYRIALMLVTVSLRVGASDGQAAYDVDSLDDDDDAPYGRAEGLLHLAQAKALATDDDLDYLTPTEQPYMEATVPHDQLGMAPGVKVTAVPHGLAVLFQLQRPLCSATIVRPAWVLTAASCFDSIHRRKGVDLSQEISLRATFDGRIVDYKVVNIHYHPSYSPTSNNYNIILLKVDHTLERPFDLYDQHEYTNNSLADKCSILSLNGGEASQSKRMSPMLLPDTCDRMMKRKMKSVNRAPSTFRALGFNNLCLLPAVSHAEPGVLSDPFCPIWAGSPIFCAPFYQKVQGIVLSSPFSDSTSCEESPVPFLYASNELFWILKTIETDDKSNPKAHTRHLIRKTIVSAARSAERAYATPLLLALLSPIHFFAA